MRRPLILLLLAGVASVASATPTFVVSPDAGPYCVFSETHNHAWRVGVRSPGEGSFDRDPARAYLSIPRSSSAVLDVIEAGDGASASAILESGGGTNSLAEGFLGVTSNVGIAGTRFRVVDATTSLAVQRCFEREPVPVGTTIAPLPSPGAVLLCTLGAALVGFLRWRKAIV